MRAHQHTFAALNTDIGVPNGDFLGDVAFFVLGGASGIGAVTREGGYRKVIPSTGGHRSEDITNESRGGIRDNRFEFCGFGVNLARDGYRF